MLQDRSRLFLMLGSSGAFLAVAFGAFGSHSLKAILEPSMLAVFETGVRYQMYHALALLFVGWACRQFPQASFHIAGWLFAAGILLFSGSLYVLTLSGVRWLGAITPLGGACFLGGWGIVAWQAFRISEK
jgi:uncharacterized membrane protein YgdD (TMEM256/DUF423 family)